MALDFEERNRKRNARLRSLYDYTMGVLWMAIGVFFLWHRKWGFDLELDKTLTAIFGASALLYGAFRLYRGYKAQ
jgi:hypothetical protein